MQAGPPRFTQPVGNTRPARPSLSPTSLRNRLRRWAGRPPTSSGISFSLSPTAARPATVEAVEIRPGNARAVHHGPILLIDRSPPSARTPREESRMKGFPGNGTSRSNPENVSIPIAISCSGSPAARPGRSRRAWPGIWIRANDFGTECPTPRATGKTEMFAKPSIGLYFTRPSRPSKFPILLQTGARWGALEYSRQAIGDFQPLLMTSQVPVDVGRPWRSIPMRTFSADCWRALLSCPTGTRRWIVRIPDWNLNWQAVYRLSPNRCSCPRGSVISMRFPL